MKATHNQRVLHEIQLLAQVQKAIAMKHQPRQPETNGEKLYQAMLEKLLTRK